MDRCSWPLRGGVSQWRERIIAMAECCHQGLITRWWEESDAKMTAMMRAWIGNWGCPFQFYQRVRRIFLLKRKWVWERERERVSEQNWSPLIHHLDLKAANSGGVQNLLSCGSVVFEIQVHKTPMDTTQKPLGEKFLEKHLNLPISERTVEANLKAAKRTVKKLEFKVLRR